MKHHSILSQFSDTLSGFRNLTKHSCIWPMAINARKLFIEYSKINKHMNLPERQLRSLQRWSKFPHDTGRKQPPQYERSEVHWAQQLKGAVRGRVSSQQHFPSTFSQTAMFSCSRTQPEVLFFPSHLRASLGLSSMSFCSLPLSPLKSIPWVWAPQLYSWDG